MNSTLATYFLHLKTPFFLQLTLTSSFHHSQIPQFHLYLFSQNTISRLLLLKSQLQKPINPNAQNPRQNSNSDWRRSFHCRQIPLYGLRKPKPPAALTERNPTLEEEQEEEDIEKHQNQNQSDPSTPLQAFLESNAEAIESLNSLLQQKLENGQDEEALKIVKLFSSCAAGGN
ncbi:hypothetical protein OIU79_004320 [Salix purpurea]|uniref:Uncharacterized protein n=1 Tax=Salix purpurea TaxID=77065 RepID=A0A9Q0Z9F6_SALPP|nr:hypothetical protein OIU79_004320 [Salix purpurea]